MTTIVFNGQEIDLGGCAELRFAYHAKTPEQAEAAILEMRKLIANEDVDWEAKVKASGGTVWLSQDVAFEDGDSVTFTVFFPSEITERERDAESIYIDRASEFVASILANDDDVTDHSALHEEAERERLDAEYYGPDWDGQS